MMKGNAFTKEIFCINISCFIEYAANIYIKTPIIIEASTLEYTYPSKTPLLVAMLLNEKKIAAMIAYITPIYAMFNPNIIDHLSTD